METSEMRNIIESVNTKWPKDYIIRYLYVKLAPFFQGEVIGLHAMSSIFF